MKEGLATIIEINFKHSHALKNAEAWSWLKRTSETKESFLHYFSEGMSLADAMRYHSSLLMAEDIESLANSSKNPPSHWVYVLHNAWRKDHYGELTPGPDFFRIAEEKKNKLEEAGYILAIHSQPFVLCVITPIMQRALRFLKTKESFFLDTSSSCDQSNSALTIISIATKAGAVPVGVLIHEGQSETIYRTGLELLKTLWEVITLPLIENFMTDDSMALKNALLYVWPDVRQLLCQFHVLQALWRWLWDSKHGISKYNRKPLMCLFKCIMYATNETDAELALQALNTKCSKYITFCEHINTLFVKRDEWCTAYRAGVITRNNDTNNYAEATFRIVKDIMLTRLRAYSPLALLDYVTVVLEKYYKLRLIDASFGRLKKPYLIFQKHQDKGMAITQANPEAVQQISANTFVVRSQNFATSYQVESDLGLCTCPAGNRGAFCKHQAAVHIKFGHCFPNSPALTTEDKHEIYEIAVGSSYTKKDFFSSMMEYSDEPQSASQNLSSSTFPQPVATPTSSGTVDEITVCDTSHFSSELDRMKEMLNANSSDAGLMKVANNFFRKFKNVQTPMQLYHFLNTSIETHHRRKKIKVQPTSVSRRREGATHGSGRQRSGRPSKQLKIRGTKRAHSLALNIEANQANSR